MASRIRRKPQSTYKSPSVDDDQTYISASLTYSRGSSPSSSTKILESSDSSSKGNKKYDIRSVGRRRYSITPPLPLFHPFGRLAMSLPPLDPVRYGLPVLSVPDEVERKPSSRRRRPPSKYREIEDGPPPSNVSNAPAVAAHEFKDRPSPRKRRGGPKRKRRDVDDADATYPAKRTRLPRGASGAQGIEDDSLVENIQQEAADSVEAAPELSDQAKRRSARARGSLKRRDSSASETNTSVSASAIIPPVGSIDAMFAEETTPKLDVKIDAPVGDDDKEEGELSEEVPGTS